MKDNYSSKIVGEANLENLLKEGTVESATLIAMSQKEDENLLITQNLVKEAPIKFNHCPNVYH
jgi:hypothetical protein